MTVMRRRRASECARACVRACVHAMRACGVKRPIRSQRPALGFSMPARPRRAVAACLLVAALQVASAWKPPGPPQQFVTDIHGDGPPVNTWGNVTADSTLGMVTLAAYPDAVCNGAPGVAQGLALCSRARAAAQARSYA